MSDQVRDYADKAFREALLKPDNLRDLLRAQVPDLVDGFDVSRARVVQTHFLVPDGRGREADLLFEIPYRTADKELIALVCVLIEHQTRADPRMALRTLLYVVLYWEKQWSAWEALPAPRPEFRLAPVLPIVFHTGTTLWGSPRSIAEMLGDPEAFHVYAPQWKPLFWELPKHSVEELLSSEEAFLQLLAVVRVEDADYSEFERVFRETWIHLARLQDSNRVRWADLIYFIIGWITHRRPAAERRGLIELAENLAEHEGRGNEVRTMVETYADVLLAKGKSEGKIEGMKEIIIRQGARRLGSIDPDAEVALNAISDLELLKRIADRVHEVSSWAELLATT
jgi:hypothetical protein